MRPTFRSRALSALSGCALCLAGCGAGEAPSESAHEVEAEEAVWITTSRDALPWLTWLLDAPPVVREPAPRARVSALVAVQVPSRVLPELSEIEHEEQRRCGGYMLHDTEAAALDELDEEALEKARYQRAPATYTVDNRATVETLLSELSEPNVLATVRKLSSYLTRYHASMTGQEASKWLFDTWAALAVGRGDARVSLIDHDKTPQPSVSLTIRGSRLPDEYVILGGHLDSIAGRGSVRGAAPGADDNASGIATLTEIARVAMSMAYRPERSVVFYAYAAEEVGLIGSAEIATLAKASGRNIVGVLQFDMTNFTSAREPYITLIRDYTDPELNLFSAQLIDTYLDLPWKYDECGYACSDHASWNARGFPTTFPHEATLAEGNQRIHTADDSLALSRDSVGHAMHFARLGAAFLAELGKGGAGGGVSPPMPTGTERCTSSICVSRDGADARAPACGGERGCADGLACVDGACVDPPSIRVERDAGAGRDAGGGQSRDAGRTRTAVEDLGDDDDAARAPARPRARSGGCAARDARAESGAWSALAIAVLTLWGRRAARGRRRTPAS